MNDIHEGVENDEFEAELEAVDGCFEDRLDGEHASVFGGEKGEVQKDDEDVHPDEVVEDFSSLLLLEDLAWPEDFAGFPEVKAGDD